MIKVKSLVINLSLVFFSLAILLLIIEGGLRVVAAIKRNFLGSDLYVCGNVYLINPALFKKALSPDPNFMPVNIETSVAGRHVRTNSSGMRAERDYSLNKALGVYRIATIGDSVTFGWGVDYNEAYPAVLENILRARFGDKVEVLNFGMPSLNSQEELLLLKSKILNYDPNLIIIGYHPNDIYYDLKLVHFFNTFVPRFLAERSRLYGCVFSVWQHLTNSYAPYYQEAYKKGSPLWETQKSFFAELSFISREKKIPIFVVVLPEWRDFSDKHRLKQVYDLVSGEAIKNGLSALNVFSMLRDKGVTDVEKNYRVDFNSEDYDHPNRVGHEAIAGLIFEFLLKSGFLRSN